MSICAFGISLRDKGHFVTERASGWPFLAYHTRGELVRIKVLIKVQKHFVANTFTNKQLNLINNIDAFKC